MTRAEIVEAGAKALSEAVPLYEGHNWDRTDELMRQMARLEADAALTAMLPAILAGVAEALFREHYQHSLMCGEAYDRDDPRKEMMARDTGIIKGLERAERIVKEWTP